MMQDIEKGVAAYQKAEQLPFPMPPPTAPHESQLNKSPPTPPYDATSSQEKKSTLNKCVQLAVVAIITVAIVLPIVFTAPHASNSAKPLSPSTMPPQPQTSSTLDAIRERGFLQCGVADQIGFSTLSNGKREGFEVDLVRTS
jgi:hypothetical protein